MTDSTEQQLSPCEIELLRGSGGYYTKGHVNRDEFHRAVREEWGTWVPPQGVEHVWWRCVPDNTTDDYSMRFDLAAPGSRGAWPATFTYHEGPHCSWCPACKGKVQRRCDEKNRVTARKALRRLWERAEHGEPLWLTVEDDDGTGWTYSGSVSSLVRAAA